MEEQVEVYTWMIAFLSSLMHPYHSGIAASQPQASSKLIWKKLLGLVARLCVCKPWSPEWEFNEKSSFPEQLQEKLD